MPTTAMNVCMVLYVNMPPQLPWPGQACSAICVRRRGVGVARGLERRHEVDPLAVHGIGAGLDRAVGQDDRRHVLLEDGRERADRRLVARDHRDEPSHVVRVQVRVGRVVHELAADQRVAHALGAVELPIRHAERERRGDEPHGQVVATDAGGQGRLDGLHLFGHAQIALAVAESPE